MERKYIYMAGIGVAALIVVAMLAVWLFGG